MPDHAQPDLRGRMLEDLEQRLEELPVLPEVVCRLAMMNPDVPGFAEEVEALARHDPPLAFRLLRLARIEEAALDEEFQTLSHALTRIGARSLSESVTGFSVMRVFVPVTRGQRALWLHSLQVAVGARIIADARPELGVDPEVAYLAGLLHDIGRFVMFDRSAQELGEVEETGFITPQELLLAERKIFGYDHAELGWHACRRWAIGELVSALIRDHHLGHSEEDLERIPHEIERLVRVVQQADLLSVLMLKTPAFLVRKMADRRAFLVKRMAFKGHRLPISPMLLEGHLDQLVEESETMTHTLLRDQFEPLAAQPGRDVEDPG